MDFYAIHYPKGASRRKWIGSLHAGICLIQIAVQTAAIIFDPAGESIPQQNSCYSSIISECVWTPRAIHFGQFLIWTGTLPFITGLVAAFSHKKKYLGLHWFHKGLCTLTVFLNILGVLVSIAEIKDSVDFKIKNAERSCARQPEQSYGYNEVERCLKREITPKNNDQRCEEMRQNFETCFTKETSFHIYDGEALNQRIVLYGILTALCILQCFFSILGASFTCTGLYECNKKQDAQAGSMTPPQNILSIMSVGRSGVGKSTIGNMLLCEEAEGYFPTSTSTYSCTQTPTRRVSSSGDCEYIDVPGIPDTNPANTVEFYDMIIEEARKHLSVILFVFKRERVDSDAYMLAEMLFRELNMSNAAKILVINDQNRYKFKKPPTEKEYQKQMTKIKNLTKIEFTHSFVIDGDTMEERLKALKINLSQMKREESGHLKSFSELREYVNELRNKKNFEEEVVRQEKDRIISLKKQLEEYQGNIVIATVVSVVATVASIFTMGATLGLVTPTAAAALVATTTIQVKKAELQAAEKKISPENVEKAALELKEACEKFEELERALKSRF